MLANQRLIQLLSVTIVHYYFQFPLQPFQMEINNDIVVGNLLIYQFNIDHNIWQYRRVGRVMTASSSLIS